MAHRVDRPRPALADMFHTSLQSTALPSWVATSVALRCAALIGVLLACVLAGWLWLDGPVAVYALNHSHPEPLEELLAVAEPFGNGISVLLIVALIWRLDPQNLRRTPRMLTMAIGAGMVADALKVIVGRYRPVTGSFDPADMASTFVGWWPGVHSPSAIQSFPSAHTATAVGLALALAWVYPRGRVLFLGGAVLVGLERIAYGAHFVSDVYTGAILGLIVATTCLHSRRIDRWFCRLEEPREVTCDPQAIDELYLRTEVIPVPHLSRADEWREPQFDSTAQEKLVDAEPPAQRDAAARPFNRRDRAVA
ncbi:MAG: phosphatase PAP2 family protein [Pirellulales bacterium]|nr:phosphatase PAP2 family protein [Pirellulales bacterium]